MEADESPPETNQHPSIRHTVFPMRIVNRAQDFSYNPRFGAARHGRGVTAGRGGTIGRGDTPIERGGTTMGRGGATIGRGGTT